MNDPVISCRQLKKEYHDGQSTLEILRGISLDIAAGERVAIVGPSGSGKSSLLHLLGGLDVPTQGAVLIQGTDWQMLSEQQRCQIRNQTLGFVYQFHYLLPEFTALENVAMPLRIAGYKPTDALDLARDVLHEVGLGDRLHHKPRQLSGGERQRAAIARALVRKPACVLADEPTGNLDQHNALNIFETMLALNASHQTALVMVTHDRQLAQRMDRIWDLQDGLIIE